MTNTATLDDIDMVYEDAQVEKIEQLKRAHKRKTASKEVKVRSSVEVAKDNFKAAKYLHKDEIKARRREIRANKLMIRQARNTYKLVKLSSKK